jgi:hypothetical protein
MTEGQQQQQDKDQYARCQREIEHLGDHAGKSVSRHHCRAFSVASLSGSPSIWRSVAELTMVRLQFILRGYHYSLQLVEPRPRKSGQGAWLPNARARQAERPSPNSSRLTRLRLRRLGCLQRGLGPFFGEKLFYCLPFGVIDRRLQQVLKSPDVAVYEVIRAIHWRSPAD